VAESARDAEFRILPVGIWAAPAGIYACIGTTIPRILQRRTMTDVVNDIVTNFKMSETEQKVRYGIGATAAAAAIFAPLSYRWKGVLTAVAAETILSAVYGFSVFKRIMSA
jgi:hypothetical protein